MINVKLFRIVTGEEVVAELVSEDENTITIQNGLVVLPTPNGSIGFAPWASVINKDKPETTMSRNHIVYIVEVDEKVANKYNEMFGSKLVMPESKKLIL